MIFSFLIRYMYLMTIWPELDISYCVLYTEQGFWYFAEKKQNFVGFSGGNLRKNRLISQDFRRKKSQNSRKNQRISGIFLAKSQNSQRNRLILRDFHGRKVKIRRKTGRFRGILAEKSQILKDFQGQIVRKIGRCHRKFRGGKLHQETISKRQLISLDFFGEILLKSINFVSIWPALFNVCFNRDSHLLFQQQFAREMSEC